jgi:hypothetical protein
MKLLITRVYVLKKGRSERYFPKTRRGYSSRLWGWCVWLRFFRFVNNSLGEIVSLLARLSSLFLQHYRISTGFWSWGELPFSGRGRSTLL